MTPKEKAEELVNLFYEKMPPSKDEPDHDLQIFVSKECALICVEELINTTKSYPMPEGSWNIGQTFWEEVKKELEKL